MTEPALGTTTITQVGIIVRDIEAAARAWSEALGLPLPRITTTDTVDVARTEYRGSATPARARQAFFHLGQVDVELLEPIGEPSTWRDQLNEHGASLHHIAFKVEGMQERLAFLDSQGFPLIQRGEWVGGRYAYVDSGAQLGTILELLEID